MTKLSEQSQKIKEKIKADYLAGMSLSEIGRKYGLLGRSSIYYYINPLTPMEKAAHAENKARNDLLKKKNEEI